MGVRGLQSFIKANPSFAQKIYLHDTSLVIDANNLQCALYCILCLERGMHHRSDIYGGNMIAYGQLVKDFFASLERCNITPILVFDGSVIGKQSTKNELALKERTIYQRGLDRFNSACSASEQNLHESPNVLMPQSIGHVFKSIASDLGIQRIQTPYEADSHVARIANDLNCPALTNDSDFLIYPLQVGFIMIDSFKFNNLTNISSKPCIECLIYSHARVIKNVPGLRSESMPLVSILLGNDYVEAGTFDAVTRHICNIPYHGPLRTESFNHRKIANLLAWLRGYNLDRAIETILDQVQDRQRDQVRRIVMLLLKSYKIEETDNFDAELSAIYPSSRADPEHNIHPELMPPAYIRRLIETKDLTPIALDMIFHNTHYNYPVVDDRLLPSSSCVKYRPFSLALTLIRPSSYENLTTNQRQIQAEKDSFYIYDRINGDYNRLIIRPLEKLENFGSLEHLNCYNMITLEPALKKLILMDVHRFNNDEFNLMRDTTSQIFTGDFIQESTTCMMLIKYIGLETKMQPKPQFVNAMLLTLFYYAALNGNLNTSAMEDIQYGKLLGRLRPHSMSSGIQYDQSFSLFRRICHFISQLSGAYVSYRLVNSLLNHVFPTPRYDKFLNSVLVFRLTKLMCQGELKMETFCQETVPIIFDIFATIRVMVHCHE